VNINITLYGKTVTKTFKVSFTSEYPSINTNYDNFKSKSLIHLYDRFNAFKIAVIVLDNCFLNV
jgi:hypothetical protein